MWQNCCWIFNDWNDAACNSHDASATTNSSYNASHARVAQYTSGAQDSSVAHHEIELWIPQRKIELRNSRRKIELRGAETN